MNLLSLFKYPAYLYNPKQALVRLQRQFSTPNECEVVCLPWGHPLLIKPKDFIGQSIWSQGIFELNVCEAIARLVHEGDMVVDVGANVGFMTSLLARAVGKTGHVLAFEPHPEMYSILAGNAERFSDGRSGHVSASPVALSDCEGDDWLVYNPELFGRNSGTAALQKVSSMSGDEKVKLRTSTLDPFICGKTVTLLKIDVEGAELRVLRGAARALAERRIMAIVYEDFCASSSGIADFLKEFGFSVFHLDRNLVRPRLRKVHEGFHQVMDGQDQNFLAALDAHIVERAYRRLGWRVFSL